MKPENTTWHFITDETQLSRLKEEIEHWSICDVTNMDTLLFLGYKFLSDEEKTTYRYLYSLAKSTSDNYLKMVCKPSLDYLSTIFGTTENCQYRRIANLKKAKLLIQIKKSTYQLFTPSIESTFVETIEKLINRKKLSWHISLYKDCNNPIKRLEHITAIKLLKEMGAKHPHLDSVLTNPTIEVKPEDLINNFILQKSTNF